MLCGPVPSCVGSRRVQPLLRVGRGDGSEGREGRDLARTISAFSVEVEIDAQWRLTVPATLRAYAGLELERPVMVIGALNHIELWQTELWMERATPTLESLANGTSPCSLTDDAGRVGPAASREPRMMPFKPENEKPSMKKEKGKRLREKDLP